MQSNDTISPYLHFRDQKYPSQWPEGDKNCTLIGRHEGANWENIPETLILNGSIGIVLFLAFVILTWIAWSRADSSDQLVTQNIITFLYGYRDPEQWYVIPRLEFLRRGDRHHRHDLLSSQIYVPPKLPLANPLEMIALGDQDRDHSSSVDSSRTAPISGKQTASQKDPEAGLIKSLNVMTNQTGKSLPQSAITARSLETVNSDPLSRAQTSSDVTSSVSRMGSADTRRDPATESNFYPSILTAEQLRASALSRKLNRFFGVFFRVSDADLIYARGIDSYEYLLFQRHLILIMLVTTILCIGVILPIHWIAGSSADPRQTTSFQLTTIKNISSSPNLHWAHIICSSFIVFTTLKVMSSYRESIITQTEPQISKRTLLIGNIPSEQRTRAKLTGIFREYFSQINVEAIQFVYDCKPLINDEMYLSSIIAAKDYCIAYRRKSRSEIYVHQTDVNEGQVCDGYCRFCSFIYVCCCYWPCQTKEPGTVFYAREEERFRRKIAGTCEKIIGEPTEYAFVTFRSYRQARRVISELASIKRDAIESKPRHEITPTGARKPKSQISELPHGPAKFVKSARGKRVKAESPEERQIKIKTAISKYVETTNSHSDPLDPKNNPHVRSIRSPKVSSSHSNSSASKELPQEVAMEIVAAKDTGNQSNEQGWDMNEGPIRWSVRYAPHPDNIDFNDLLNYARTSKWTILFLHLLMVIIFIFITTPNVILSIIERISVLNKLEAKRLTGFEQLTINYFSILLQITTTAILPALVTLISKQIPYEDSSSKSHSVMWKSYSFLILMVIVMPSIGMSSATKLFNEEIHLMCLFSTDNGAYYINYVVSSIFLSTMLELIKPIDIVFYYFIVWTSRSSAEVESGRQFIDREFSVGMQHTGVLLIFSVVMTYSISCPLIAPVGLIYLCVKHAVDHYNLYYSYFTRKVDKDMQSTIVIFVKVALLLMLFQTTVAILINTKGMSYFSLISQMIFWVVLATLGFNCFFDCTARTLPNTKNTRWHHEFCACFYLPKVIASLLRMDAIPSSCVSRKV